MNTQFNEFFLSRWRKYFADTELPLAYFYTDQVSDEDLQQSANDHRCLIGNLDRVRQGFPFVYHARMTGCAGGKRYTGFSQKLRPDFDYFLSCGIPGRVTGERYKKSPELVGPYLQSCPPFEAPGQYLVFKRWDKLRPEERPLAVIFLAGADVLAGLFTLANFDLAEANGVIAPFGAGCASIVEYPYLEANKANPKCILGMFDVTARPMMAARHLTFAVPMNRFEQMVSHMDESFLITESWEAVRKRL